VLPKAKEKMPEIGGLFKDGANVAFCDGSVQFLPRTLAPETLRALVTPKGGEPVDRDKLK
jgi:prepilin-type processing-associated H-X9-DG protein